MKVYPEYPKHAFIRVFFLINVICLSDVSDLRLKACHKNKKISRVFRNFIH